jgi:hypothetical protein
MDASVSKRASLASLLPDLIGDGPALEQYVLGGLRLHACCKGLLVMGMMMGVVMGANPTVIVNPGGTGTVQRSGASEGEHAFKHRRSTTSV